jgi:hypothetical protein
MEVSYPVLRAVDPWQALMNVRLTLTGIKMLPSPLITTILHRAFLTTLWTTPLMHRSIVNPKIYPVNASIRSNLSQFPVVSEPEKLLIQVRASNDTSHSQSLYPRSKTHLTWGKNVSLQHLARQPQHKEAPIHSPEGPNAHLSDQSVVRKMETEHRFELGIFLMGDTTRGIFGRPVFMGFLP